MKHKLKVRMSMECLTLYKSKGTGELTTGENLTT
jgi:hypothetical protein